MKKNKKKSAKGGSASGGKKIWKRVAKVHLKITSVIFIIYLLVSLIFDPRFLLQDFREKYHTLADEGNIAVTLHVANPNHPGRPTVTSQSGCTPNNPYISLSWNETADTNSYDIYRNSALLMTGLVGNSFTDNTVQNDTSYTYQVIANGLAENTASDEISATSNDCHVIVPPICSVATISKGDVKNSQDNTPLDVPKITDNTPTLSGVTNIPYAIINILIHSGPVVSGTTIANVNATGRGRRR